jgi:EmrB/QacA subfamily drug resistance transporter
MRGKVAPETSRRLTLAATILGSSMAYVTAVSVAVPVIGEQFGIGLAGQQWIVLSYSLALASLYLVAGALGDRMGRRETFVAGTIGFALASALAGAAPNTTVLIVGRVLQGAAGALLTTGSLALLRQTFGKESGRAIGLWTAGTGAVSLGGPPLGGALVEWASWRWIFYLNVPLAVAAVVLARLGSDGRAPARATTAALDIPGAALAAVGIGSLTYGLVEGGERGFASVAWAFAVASAGLGLFLVRELRASEPLLPLGLFRNRDFALVNVTTLLVYSALAGSTFFLVLYLQSVIGYSPFEVGLLLIPSTLVLLVLAPPFGRLGDRYGPRLFLTAGPVAMAGGMLLWTRVDDRTLWDGLLPGLLLFGLGISMIVAPITATALRAAPERYTGVAAGVNSTFSRLGSLLAIVVLGLVVAVVFAERTNDSDLVPLGLGQQGAEFKAASTDAFQAAMFVAAAIALAGAAVAFWVCKGVTTADGLPLEERLPSARLDPASPDCPAALPHRDVEFSSPASASHS